jgi:hypothetical protein
MTVTSDDGTTHDIKTAMVDIVALERAAGASAPHVFDGKVKEFPMVMAQAWLAHHVMRRKGLTTLGFDAWLETGVDVESKPEAPPVPLDQDLSTG